jgi:hypothetical protein
MIVESSHGGRTLWLLTSPYDHNLPDALGSGYELMRRSRRLRIVSTQDSFPSSKLIVFSQIGMIIWHEIEDQRAVGEPSRPVSQNSQPQPYCRCATVLWSAPLATGAMGSMRGRKGQPVWVDTDTVLDMGLSFCCSSHALMC